MFTEEAMYQQGRVKVTKRAIRETSDTKMAQEVRLRYGRGVGEDGKTEEHAWESSEISSSKPPHPSPRRGLRRGNP